MSAAHKRWRPATMSSASDSNPQTIAIHFGTPKGLVESFLPGFFPRNNFAGALLLHRIVESALVRAGLLPGGRIRCNGELNDCLLNAEVTDVSAAVGAITREFGSSAFGSMFQIGVLKEDGWHSVHPSSGARANWLFEAERHELADKKSDASFLAFCTACEVACPDIRAEFANASGEQKRVMEKIVGAMEETARTVRKLYTPEPIEPGEDAP